MVRMVQRCALVVFLALAAGLPGLIDSHLHALEGGLSEFREPLDVATETGVRPASVPTVH
jgi:hypothetical protein